LLDNESKMLSYVDQFFRSRSYSRETERSYSWMLFQLARWLDRSRLSLDDLDPDLLNRFLTERGWNVNSRYLAVCAARAFCRWLYGGDHPLMDMRLSKSRRRIKPQRTLNELQVRQLLYSIDTSQPIGRRDLAIVALMLDTGLREAELCNLELQYLDLYDQIIRFIGKGGNWEAVTIPTYTAVCLSSWLADRDQLARQIEVDRTVFINLSGGYKGKRLSGSGLRHLFRRLADRAGLPALSPHDLRRTFCCLMLQGKASTRLVQIAGRWKDIAMVERYSQALRPEDIEPFSVVNRIMEI